MQQKSWVNKLANLRRTKNLIPLHVAYIEWLQLISDGAGSGIDQYKWPITSSFDGDCEYVM